jgi:hypothetical protein
MHLLSPLELGLGRLERVHQHVADIVGRLVEVVAHLVAAQTLGNDVEVEAGREKLAFILHLTQPLCDSLPVLVDHVGNAEALVNDLAPAVAVEVLGAELARRQVP